MIALMVLYVGYEGPIPLSFKLCYDDERYKGLMLDQNAFTKVLNAFNDLLMI